MDHLIARRESTPTSRRAVVFGTAAAAMAGTLRLSTVPAAASPAELQSAVDKVTAGARVVPGRIKIDIPPLVENGNAVPCTVSVDSPMTEQDHVRAIHLFTQKNPQPNVISAEIGPRAGLAEISTRIRLAETQTVLALAELSDGSFCSATVEVVITLGACLEDPL